MLPACCALTAALDSGLTAGFATFRNGYARAIYWYLTILVSFPPAFMATAKAPELSLSALKILLPGTFSMGESKFF